MGTGSRYRTLRQAVVAEVSRVWRVVKPRRRRETMGRLWVDPLEQRTLLTVSNVSISPATLTPTENTADTFALSAASDNVAGLSGWTVAWGDGQVDSLSGSATSDSHAYAAPGNYTVTATASDADNSGDATASIQVQDAPLSAGSGVSISASATQTWSGNIASFYDPDPDAQVSDYSATTNWGDGNTSTSSITSAGSGNFTVSDSHTFALPGSYAPVVTIDDYGGSTISVTDSASVGLPPFSVNGPGSTTLQENQSVEGFNMGSISGFVPGGTFSYSVDDFPYGSSPSIDGSGNIIASGSASGPETDASDFVSVTESYGGQSLTETSAPFTLTVQDAPLSASGGVYFGANVGQSWSGAVATFYDPDPDAQASLYTATTSWGDGNFSNSSITSNGGGYFTVSDSHTYSAAGNYSLVVSINDSGGSTASAIDSASVSLAGFSLTAPNLTVEQGQSYSGSIGQITDSAGSYSNSSYFSGSLTYNGWIYGVSLSADANPGVWDVDVTGLAALPAGTYSGSLYMSENADSQSITPSPATFTIDVVSPSLYATGVYINSTVGQSWSGTIANVTDDDSYDQPGSYFTAATNYGDGSSATYGSISGSSTSWIVSDTHTFTTPGSFSPTTTIYDVNNDALASASSSANVNLAGISVSASPPAVEAGQSSAVTIGTLSDGAGTYASGSYSGTLSLDGSTSYGISFVGDGEYDGNYTVVASGLSSLAVGSYSGTLSVSESAGSQSVSAVTPITITVYDAPISANGVSLSATAPEAWSGTVATFTDGNPNADASYFTASINYGDGSSPDAGTISSDGEGGFIVTDTHTFPAGTFDPTVTISDAGGASATANDSANVGLPSFSVGSPSDSTFTENQPLTNALFGNVSGFIAGGGISYSATLNGSTSLNSLSLSVDDTMGDIWANGAAPAFGAYAGATITVTESSNGQSSSATSPAFTVTSNDAPLTQVNDTPTSLNGVVGASLSPTLLHFTDGDPDATTGEYTATVNWGDGTIDNNVAVTADSNGGFDVDDSHTYGTVGSYTIAVGVGDGNGSTVSTTLAGSIVQITNDLSASPVNTGAIDLSWNLTTTDSNPSTDAVYVQRSLSPDSGFATVSSNLTGYGNFYLDNDSALTEGTRYYYQLEVTESFGTVYSPAVSVWTLPAAPSTVVATAAGSTQVALSWQNNSGDALGFQVERTGPGGSSQTFPAIYGTYTAGQSISFTDTTASAATAYTYQVQAIGDGGLSNAAASGSVTCPTAPTGLSAATISASEIDLAWTNHSADYQNVEVDRATSATGPFTALTTTLASGTSTFDDTAVAAGTTYYYEVKALNSSGFSDPSNTASATTSPVTSSFTPSSVSSGEIDLGWSLAVSDATSIEISRSTSATGTFTPILTNLPGDATSYTDDDPALAPGTEYFYQLQVTQPNGTAVSQTISSWTAPVAPSGLTASTDDEDPTGEIHLSWTPDPSDFSDNIQIERATAGSGSFSVIATVANEAEDLGEYSDQGLPEGASYDYRIQAIGGGGVGSVYTSTASASTDLDAPSDLQTSNDSSGNVVITWTNNSSAATAIAVQRESETTGDGFETIATVGPNVTTFTDSTGIAGQTYIYQTVAYNDKSGSAPSSPDGTATGAEGFPANYGMFGYAPTPNPTDLTATLLPTDSTGEEKVLLSWTGPNVSYVVGSAAGSDVPLLAAIHGDEEDDGDGTLNQLSTESGTTAIVTAQPGSNAYFIVDNPGFTGLNPGYAETSLTIPPTISFGGFSGTTNEIEVQTGSELDLGVTVNYDKTDDPSSLTNWSIDWGDDTSPSGGTSDPTNTTIEHTFTSSGIYTATITVTTAEGDATQTLKIFATPRPITFGLDSSNSAVVGSSITENAGTSFTLPITVDNPDNVAIQDWTVDWEDGSAIQAYSGSSPALTHTYANGPLDTWAVVTAFTAVGAVSNTFLVDITGGSEGGGVWPYGCGYLASVTTFNLGGDTNAWNAITFNPDFLSFGTYSLNWGDGSSTSGIPTSTIETSHTYANPGAYLVTETLDGTDGGTFSEEEAYIAPYPPAGLGLGSVTIQPLGSNAGYTVSAPITGFNDGNDVATIDWGNDQGPQFAQIDGNEVTATLDQVPTALSAPILTVYDDDGDPPASQTFQLPGLGVNVSIQSVITTGTVPLSINQTSPSGGTSGSSSPTPGIVPLDEGISGVPYYDANGSQVPEFADGFGLNPADPNQSQSPTIDQTQSQLVITIPAGTDLSTATLTFNYDGADPSSVTFTGSGTPEDPYVYSLNNSNPLRLWTGGVAPSEPTSLASFLSDEGTPTLGTNYYVAPDVAYPISFFSVSTDNPTASPTVILNLEGVNAAQNSSVSVTLSNNAGDVSGNVSATVEKLVDLADDSDNTVAASGSADFTPTAYQEQIKDNPALSGGALVVDDAMQDGVPAFASGFTMDPSSESDDDSSSNGMENFAPLAVTLPAGFDISQAMFSFTYSAADPAAVIAPSSDEPNIGYSAGGGNLRLWMLQDGHTRSGLPVNQGGSFVAANAAYSGTELGFTGDANTITLYVEAVAASAKLGDLQVTVRLEDIKTGLYQNDTVRFTAIQDAPMYYGSSANVLLGDASGSDGGDPMAAAFDNAVNLSNLTVSTPAVTDLSSSGFGQNFGITRVYSTQLVDQLMPGIVGNGWVVSDLPTLVNATTSVIVNVDGNSSLFFDLMSQSEGSYSYKARFFSQEQLSYASGSGLYTLTDTVGDTFVFYGFDASLNMHQRGQLKSYTDAAGNEINFNYGSGGSWPGSLQTVTRTDGTTTETWTFTYNTVNSDYPYAPYELSNLTLSRSGGSNTGVVDQVAYTYYSAGDSNGEAGDLQTAQLQDASGNPLATYYYRYYLSSDTVNSRENVGLKLAIGPSGYARFEGDTGEPPNDSDDDSTLDSYVDYALAGGGSESVGEDVPSLDLEEGFSEAQIPPYATIGSPIGMNVVSNVVTITSPYEDASTVYSNYAGEIMLNVVGPQDTGYVYDNSGRQVLQINPSAIKTYNPDAPDLFLSQPDGTYLFLSSGTGLIDETIYSTSTSSSSQPFGYAIQSDELHGDGALATGEDDDALDDGSDDPISSMTYTTAGDGGDDDDDSPVYVVATQIQYAGTDLEQGQTTRYAYPKWNGLRPAEIVTTPPIVSGNQEGAGSAQPTTVWYDTYGNAQWMQDATGQVSYTGYDNATGAVTLSITDADPSEMPDEISPPDDLTRPTSLPTANPQTTITVVDNQGRPTSVTDPNGKTATYAYADSASDEKVTVTPPTGPVQVTDSNLDKGWTDSYTSAGGTIESLTRQISNIAGTSLTTDTFTNLSGITYSDTAALGAQNTNYSQTIQTDSGPPDGVDTSVSTDDLGNVTQTTTNAFGQAVAVQEWSAAAFAAGAAGVTLETDEYDADGNEIQTTDYPGHGEAPQVTDMEFNWLDEQVASESGVGTSTNQISFNVLNNLGEPTTEEELSGKNLTFADDPDGEPQVPSGAQLVAETVVQTDADGNPDSADQMNVNPTTGSVVGTSGETTENYYDQDGNVVASEDPNGVWTKTVYNDEGEVSAVYTTDGGGDDPFSVDGDVVSSQQEFQYDDDGNTILTTTRTRLATASPSATGALDSSDSTVDYLADYYDADDRQIEEADFGDNGGTDMTAPPALADVPAPGTDDDVLVTQTDYDADGNVADTIDSTGTETKYSYDADGEVTQEIDNYIASIDGGNPTGEANLTTDYTYDGDGDVLTQTAEAPSGQVDQKTQYVYGTGPTAGDVVQVENPDPVTGAPSTAANEDQTETLDNLGDVLSETDPDGTAQTFNYNALDQMTLDDITALGSGESGLVRATGYTYAPDGQAFQTTDYSNASASTIADQTQDVYDGYGNQIGEYDSEQGPVTSSTPETTDTPNADGDDTGSSDPLGDTDSDTYQGDTLTQVNQSGHDIPAQYNYDPVTGQLSSLNLYQSGTVGSGTPETTTWTYDPKSGQITNETFADGTQDNYTYNDKQQLATETLPGETITDGYNTAGDQTSSTAVDSITGTTVTDTSTYGTDGMLSSVSQSTSGATTSSASNTFTYDDDGNVASETQAGGVTTEYTYFGDGTNNPGAVESVKLVQDDETLSETDYAYNSAQQLTSMTVNGQTFTYGYQSGTNVISSVTTGGVTTTYGYNADTGNLTSINAGSGAYSASYSYNTNNQRQTQTVSQTNSAGSIATQNYAYAYNNANELTGVTSGGSTIYGYSYDGAGNRTDAAFTTQYGTANSMNEYSGITYNARGDITDDGTYTDTWNANNQLTSVTADNNSVRVTLSYDGQGRLIEWDTYSQNDGAWTLTATRKLVYDGSNVVEELDGDNNPVTGYAYGPQGLEAVTDYTGSTPKTYDAVLDGSGNVVELIDPATGLPAANYTYNPYRGLVSATGPAAGVCDVLAGQGITIQSVQMNVFGAREENWSGFWLSQDPTGVEGGLNTFVYCGNDPINQSDANGLDPTTLDPNATEYKGFKTGTPAVPRFTVIVNGQAVSGFVVDGLSAVGPVGFRPISFSLPAKDLGDWATGGTWGWIFDEEETFQALATARIAMNFYGDRLISDFEAAETSPDPQQRANARDRIGYDQSQFIRADILYQGLTARVDVSQSAAKNLLDNVAYNPVAQIALVSVAGLGVPDLPLTKLPSQVQGSAASQWMNVARQNSVKQAIDEAAENGPITDPARMLPAPAGTPLPQDISVNPTAPRGLPWQNRIVGGTPAQNAALQGDIQEALNAGATDIRVNQQQVNALGQRVGINRPDLSYTRPDGVRVHIEYDNTTPGTFPNTPRGPGHADRIISNDGKSIVILRSF